MAARSGPSPVRGDGILLIDKPTGPSSFDAVRAVRRAIEQRKVGHAGTLDPLASGLLVVCVGQGTKLVPFLMESEKRYRARIALGATTDTDDALGEVIETTAVPRLDPVQVQAALSRFEGTVRQEPPVFSALKSRGEPLYKKARRGEQVTTEPREVVIHKLDLLGISADEIEIDVRCGKGTYIRSLARDLGRALDTLGHLKELRRLETSGFSVDQAIALGDLEEAARTGALIDRLIAPKDALVSMPKIELSPQNEERIGQGQYLPTEEVLEPSAEPPKKHLALIGQNGKLKAIAKIEQSAIKPVRVFNWPDAG